MPIISYRMSIGMLPSHKRTSMENEKKTLKNVSSFYQLYFLVQTIVHTTALPSQLEKADSSTKAFCATSYNTNVSMSRTIAKENLFWKTGSFVGSNLRFQGFLHVVLNIVMSELHAMSIVRKMVFFVVTASKASVALVGGTVGEDILCLLVTLRPPQGTPASLDSTTRHPWTKIIAFWHQIGHRSRIRSMRPSISVLCPHKKKKGAVFGKFGVKTPCPQSWTWNSNFSLEVLRGESRVLSQEEVAAKVCEKGERMDHGESWGCR